ncbi:MULTISPECIES: fatty acyl-AMP ligase [unclassified Nocardia]|uniref:fatty acyl-AMP ligase n=1 Tax=unclassified Nocardia TaxID=2637762 RepID=UPI001CE471B3|nr:MULTISPECIES: fatty acyl-AMP ligase [unclassified Nocardia]
MTTLVDALRERCERNPGGEAYSFVSYPDSRDTHGQVDSLTFAETDRAARAFAVTLSQLARPGDRAVLLLPPGLDYVTAFFGCLYAGVVAVPLFPPSAHQSNDRLDAVCLDADPVCLITADADLPTVSAWLDDAPSEITRLVLNIAEVDPGFADSWARPELGAEDIALLQYTSGSTRTPAGVMVPHRGLLANGRQIYEMFDSVGISADEPLAFVSWLPLFHDMGLMVGVTLPVVGDDPVLQMSPMSFLRRPERWLRAIGGRPEQTMSAAPNMAYELCTQRIKPEQLEGVDLSRWRFGLCGAEPVRASTIRRFQETFAGNGLPASTVIAGYGLAEATLIVSANWRTESGIRIRTVDRDALAKGIATEAVSGVEVVGAGSVVPDTDMLIVDPATHERLPEDRIGEVWVHGPAVAAGYFNRPAETAQTFHAELTPPDGKHYMRTGDLGFLHDGELYPTSRLKDLIIVDGRNLYPPDLETTAEQAHPQVLPGRCSIFSIEQDAQEKVVVLVETQRGRSAEDAAAQLRDSVRQAIFDTHAVSVHEVVLLAPGAIPRTSSGKIQRSASRTAYLDGTLRNARAR